MGRTVTCPAGEWTAIFNHAFVQMPWDWTVTFTAPDGGAIVGEVVEKRTSWIFPNPPETRTLEPVMPFRRGWWNTFYSVRVRPERDVVATIS
ncbi:hypothetical protein K2Z83_01940 [Oscillochloris sp. ZM17-4]|uniref:hypothetical protein n=1 Tax=Oscillochloris sp. ZM17-4 TaxID=2866714 RepID=UPI001C73942A|nr:hypothetical protein [Oscillochloris sp. ZM17-4]MBX0326455.1 hypothetical protein [Oscillochloris sp. ZM17-4]